MITLLSTLLGLIGSFVPQVIKIYDKKLEYAQELQILQLQAQIATQKHNQQLEEIAVQADVKQYDTIYKTFYSGNSWIDGLNALVRPVITFSFFGLYVYIKYIQFGYVQGADFHTIYSVLWAQEDQALFSSIIAFYFGNRTFNKIVGSKYGNL